MPGALARSIADRGTRACSCCLGLLQEAVHPAQPRGRTLETTSPQPPHPSCTEMSLECHISIANLAGKVGEPLHVWHAVIAVSWGIGLVLH